MDLRRFQKDQVFILKTDSTRLGPYKATVTQGSAIISDPQLNADDGDKLIRPLPNGKEEIYLILSCNYSPGLHSIPPHFNLKLQKTTAIQPVALRSTTINIQHSTGIQVGDHNVLNIQNALNELVQRIEKAEAKPEDKAEAKSKLAAFLAHPLVDSVLGGVAGGLVGIVKLP